MQPERESTRCENTAHRRFRNDVQLPAAAKQVLEDLLDLAEPPFVQAPDAYASRVLHRLERALSAMGMEPHAALLVTRPWQALHTTALVRVLQQFEDEAVQDGDGRRRNGAAGAKSPVRVLGPTRAALLGTPTHDAVLADTTGIDALRHGFGEALRVTALPLTASPETSGSSEERQVLGALVHYRRADLLEPVSLQFLPVLTQALGVHLRCHAAQRENAQLREALESRLVIEQAKGILAERWNCTFEGAFGALRRYARAHHCKLHDVCRTVTEGAETLSRLTPPGRVLASPP